MTPKREKIENYPSHYNYKPLSQFRVELMSQSNYHTTYSQYKGSTEKDKSNISGNTSDKLAQSVLNYNKSDVNSRVNDLLSNLINAASKKSAQHTEYGGKSSYKS